MQKRLYTKGYYSHRSKTLKKPETITPDTATGVASNTPSFKIECKKPNKKNEELTAANTVHIIQKPLLTDGCDTIVLQNGAKVLAEIKEINLTKILFKNCNSADETIIFIKKSDVSYINFANGSKQIFNSESNYNQPQNLPGERNLNPNNPPPGRRGKRSNSYAQSSNDKLNPFALISFIISVVPYPFILILFALFGLISLAPSNPNIFNQVFGAPHTLTTGLLIPYIFVIAAIVMSSVAIYQIKNNGSDSKKGLKLAYIALILSLILLLLLLLYTF